MLWQKSGLSNHRSFLPIPNALTDPCICQRRSGSRGDYSSSPPPPTKPRIAYEREPAIWGFPPQRLPRSHLPSSETTLSRKLKPRHREEKHHIDPRGWERFEATATDQVASQHVTDQTGGTHAPAPGAAGLPPSRQQPGWASPRPRVPPTSPRRVKRGVKLPDPPFLLS